MINYFQNFFYMFWSEIFLQNYVFHIFFFLFWLLSNVPKIGSVFFTWRVIFMKCIFSLIKLWSSAFIHGTDGPVNFILLSEVWQSMKSKLNLRSTVNWPSESSELGNAENGRDSLSLCNFHVYLIHLNYVWNNFFEILKYNITWLVTTDRQAR